MHGWNAPGVCTGMWVLRRNGPLGRVASGQAGQVGWAQTVSFPFNQRIFQFTSKAPSSKIHNLIFLLLKILQTLHADIVIQIEQFSFLVQLPNLSIF
jgi:hypothetical protein